MISRLEEVGLSTLRLPLGSQADNKHVHILVSPNLRTAMRITLILGSPDQELGIWTWRSMAEQGINRGSMVELAKEILTTKADTALIIANMGQLVYHCGSAQAMSQRTWFALPVETAAHPPPRQTWRNLIPRNGNWREHVKCIFEDLLAPESNMVNPEAKIDVIGVEEGGLGVVEYLADKCKRFCHPHFLFFKLMFSVINGQGHHGRCLSRAYASPALSTRNTTSLSMEQKTTTRTMPFPKQAPSHTLSQPVLAPTSYPTSR